MANSHVLQGLNRRQSKALPNLPARAGVDQTSDRASWTWKIPRASGGGSNQRSCILDVDRNTLECKEPNGNWKQYDVGDSLVSVESKKIKEKNVADLVETWKQCRDSGECARSVRIRVFKIDSCPSCRSHSQSMKNVVNALSSAGVRLDVDEKDARENIGDFKRLGCNGTPCVAMTVENDRERKIYEGNHGEVGIISNIMGVKNPLYYNVNVLNENPKNLQRRK